MIKNYAVSIMGREGYINITVEVAAKISLAINNGAKLVEIAGSLYASHQITSIVRFDRQAEKDLCEMKGISINEIKTLEDYLGLLPNKQLTDGQ